MENIPGGDSKCMYVFDGKADKLAVMIMLCY